MTAQAAGVVTLKADFPLGMAGDLWLWMNSPRDPNFDDFGAQSAREFSAHLNIRVTFEKTWAVCLDGEIVGYLGFVPQSPIAGQFHGLVVDPQHRRCGIGSKAFEQAISELKRDGFKSFTSLPFADNYAIKRLLLGVGFECTGFIPRATLRNGEPVTVSVFSQAVL